MAKHVRSAAGIRALDRPGIYRAADCPTLYLRVWPGGSKSWIQRVLIKGRRHDLGLGGWPLVSLREATDQAIDNRRVLRAGGDPLAERRKAATPTFREAAEKTYAANSPNWRNAKHRSQWLQALERHAHPVLGDMPVHQIGREDVLRVLVPLWNTKAPTARKLRQKIRQVMSWCQAHGLIENNPAGEMINGALPRSAKGNGRHYRALPYRDVPDALELVAASKASIAARACLRFLVLTCVRSGEALGARWSEIDLAAREWRIPADRMKAGSDHRVPLADQAVAILESVEILREMGNDLVFPSPTGSGRPMSDMTLTKVLRDNGLADRATVHGFRATFRTWAEETTDTDHAVMELCLAHTVGSAVERAYARSDLYAKRRALMERWARHCTREGTAKVVSLRAQSKP